MKTDTVFKRAFNDALDLDRRRSEVGEPLPSENTLGAQLARQPHDGAQGPRRARPARGVVAGSGRERCASRTGRRCERFPEAETVPMSAQVEKRFMEWMLRDNARPGHRDQRTRAGAPVRRRDHRHPRVPQPLPALRPDREAAQRRLGVQGLHDRPSRSSCSRSARCSSCARRGPSPRCPTTSPLWRQLEALRDEHLALLDEIDAALPRLLRSRQPLPPADQLGRAQPLHRRLLRHHHADLSLPLPVEQAGRAAAQRGRDPRAPRLHRRAAQPERVDRSNSPAARTSPRPRKR